MDWQTEPTKKMVVNFPLRIGSKFERSEKKQIARLDLLKTLENIVKNTPYPDYRFSCPQCSSLDVFITINEKVEALVVGCLDCDKIWFEDKLVNLEVTKQCLC